MHVVYIGIGLPLREWFYSGSELGSFGWGVDIGLEFTVKGNKKGQLCNFENYKKEKGVQVEILWVHEVRVQVVTAISGLYHNLSNLHCTRTKRKWDILICWIFLFSVLNYIVFSGGTGCWIFVCLCTLYNLKYLVY